ncbi:MAG: hypothetical protein H0W99_00075 [Acidobacteria bacterium]|nr:hypothetical protein [Acidobacteriota bacterium]
MSESLERVARRYLAAFKSSNSTTVSKTKQARELEAEGWRKWFRKLFPEFKAPFAPYHVEMWEWLWPTLLAKRDNQPLPFGDAFFALWGRGGAKSTHTRRAPIAEAAVVGQGFCLYLSGTQPQANKHVASIETLLRSPSIKYYYPELSEPMRGRDERSKGWSQEFIYTSSGYIFQPIGLDVGIRGANVDNQRVSMIVPDDIDRPTDSPSLCETKMTVFLSDILPTKERDTLTICAQNLIHSNGVINRIYTGQTPALATAKFSGPYPMVENLVTERITDDRGRVRDMVRSGKPTWEWYGLDRAQSDIDTYTLEVFQRECQHDLTSGGKDGLVLRHYNDGVHVITEEEFAARFGSPEIPRLWTKDVFHDWSKTKSEYHANITGKVTVSSQNSVLPGHIFIYDLHSFEGGTEADDVAPEILKSISPFVMVGGVRRSWDELMRADLERSRLDLYMTDTTELLRARRDVLARVLPQYVQPILRAQNYRRFRMSHEAKSARDVYRRVYGLPFEGVNPGADGGIELLNHLMRVDYDRPSPFKVGVMGYTRVHIIVKSEKAAYPAVLRSNELHGSDLARFQFKHCRYIPPRMTEAGMIEQGKVLKMHDDFPNGLMMIFFDGLPRAVPLSEEEERELSLPARIRPENLAQLSPEDQNRAADAYDFWMKGDDDEPVKENGYGRYYFEGSWLKR